LEIDDYRDLTPSEWLEAASDTLQERGFEYGDPRVNLLRIYQISKSLGVQLVHPADISLVFIATKLSRILESPSREDSYIDLIAYAGILARLRFTSEDDWSDIGFDAESE
jgi:hypothetical protein